jgi:organic radical activating enzyme
MPCDYKNHRRNKAMVEKAVRLCKETGAKLGIQAHKFWGLD